MATKAGFPIPTPTTSSSEQQRRGRSAGKILTPKFFESPKPTQVEAVAESDGKQQDSPISLSSILKPNILNTARLSNDNGLVVTRHTHTHQDLIAATLDTGFKLDDMFRERMEAMKNRINTREGLRKVQMDHDYDFRNTDNAVKRKQQAYLNRMSLNPENCPYKPFMQFNGSERGELPDEIDNNIRALSLELNTLNIGQPGFDISEYQHENGTYISARAWLVRQPEAEEWQSMETVNYVKIYHSLELHKCCKDIACSKQTENHNKITAPATVTLALNNTSKMPSKPKVDPEKPWANKCPTCSTTIRGGYSAFQAHKYYNHDVSCKCGLMFDHRRALETHVRNEKKAAELAGLPCKHKNTRPGKMNATFYCDLCEEGFHAIKYMDEHRDLMHKGQFVKPEPSRRSRKKPTTAQQKANTEAKSFEEGVKIQPKSEGETSLAILPSVMQNAHASNKVKQEVFGEGLASNDIKVENTASSTLFQVETPPLGWMESASARSVKIKIEPGEENVSTPSKTRQRGATGQRQEKRQNAVRNFVCMKCGRDYSSKRSTANHLGSVHGVVVKADAEELIFQKNKPDKSKKRRVEADEKPGTSPCAPVLSGPFINQNNMQIVGTSNAGTPKEPTASLMLVMQRQQEGIPSPKTPLSISFTPDSRASVLTRTPSSGTTASTFSTELDTVSFCTYSTASPDGSVLTSSFLTPGLPELELMEQESQASANVTPFTLEELEIDAETVDDFCRNYDQEDQEFTLLPSLNDVNLIPIEGDLAKLVNGVYPFLQDLQ